ncbi:MAG: FMN-binding protein [Bacillota bacterium]
MRRLYKFLIVLLVLGLVIGAGFAYFIIRSEKELEVLLAEEIESIDLSSVSDGTYEGSYAAFPISVIVRVSIVNHEITNIEITKHVNGQGGDAEAIVDDVIDAQSLDVDLISGATYSSKVILLAIQDAIHTEPL